MKRKKDKPISQAEQSKRFIEVAREAGVDESEGALQRAIRQIDLKKPKKRTKKK